MVSLVCATVEVRSSDDRNGGASLSADEDETVNWSIVPVTLCLKEGLRSEGGRSSHDDPVVLTDAEAMAYSDGMVFVFGSGFIDQKGRFDSRRSFVARFVEEDVLVGDDVIETVVDVLELGSGLLAGLNEAIANQDVDLLDLGDRAAKRFAKSKFDGVEKPTTDLHPINIEGAAVLADSLVLGLRWPVERGGHPLLAELMGGRHALTAKQWTRDALLECPISIHLLEQVGSKKRPAGIRAMSTSDGELHVVCGPTERDIAADRVRSALLQHLRVDLRSGGATQVRSFEGLRKVEALACATGDGGWLYALDDEDAVVLVMAEKSEL